MAEWFNWGRFNYHDCITSLLVLDQVGMDQCFTQLDFLWPKLPHELPMTNESVLFGQLIYPQTLKEWFFPPLTYESITCGLGERPISPPGISTFGFMTLGDWHEQDSVKTGQKIWVTFSNERAQKLRCGVPYQTKDCRNVLWSINAK